MLLMHTASVCAGCTGQQHPYKASFQRDSVHVLSPLDRSCLEVDKGNAVHRLHASWLVRGISLHRLL